MDNDGELAKCCGLYVNVEMRVHDSLHGGWVVYFISTAVCIKCIVWKISKPSPFYHPACPEGKFN